MSVLEQKDIVKEIKTSFIDYAMSVIIERALPDLRDGLKPVHRRILYTMYEDGITPDKIFKKSAQTVGSVLGKYHPHGDRSVYDSLVRMAQDFSYRYPLVEGHGNFGSVDGDPAAAYRYTEARLSKISMEILRDINKDTVEFIDNFDNSRKEPRILPSRFPNILVNGAMGIAVGMATNIPPHNLGEIIDGCVAYIDNKEISITELMQYIKGPDFPTGAMILGNSGIKKAYETGRGGITIRSKTEIIDSAGKTQIIITELPYQVNKLELQQRIGELVRDKVLTGIADLHDESNAKNGIKVVVTLKKEANAKVVLNNLFKHTQLQVNFGIILLVIDNGEPKILNLKDIIVKYIDYQKEVIYKRTKFDLDKCEKRIHILEGLKIALDNLDAIISLIKSAKTDVEAKSKLINIYKLSEIQADAILEMKLKRLTGLEREKIEDEYKELTIEIEKLTKILSSEKLIENEIKKELLEIKERYNDGRKTLIDMSAIEYIEDESLIPQANITVTITNKNYIKRINSDVYKAQHRGGVGVKGITTNDGDFVEQIINLNTHDYVLFFSNKGKVYRIKGYEIPEYSRTSKGIPIINLLQLEKDEIIKNILTIEKDNKFKNLIFATKNGIVKKTLIEEFDNIRRNGKIAITLKDNDELISVKKTNGDSKILMCSSNGRMCKFDEKQVRSMGRLASGCRGIRLDNDTCIGLEVSTENANILVVTEKGYGKKTSIIEYRETNRGSKGVKTLKITEKTGKIVGFKSVDENMDLMIITDNGILIRMNIDTISTIGRVTQGVRLINLKEDSKVASVALIAKESSNNENEDL